MRCTNCDLPLPSGVAQTCPRCFTTNMPEKPSKPKIVRRPARRVAKPAPASEPDIEIDESESE